jgi:hypothetical protein
MAGLSGASSNRRWNTVRRKLAPQEKPHAQHFPTIDAYGANVDRFAGAMRYAQSTACAAAPGFGAGRWLPSPTRATFAMDDPSAQDRAFIVLQNAYRPYAGLMRLHRQAADRSRRPEGPACDIERLIDAGVLFGFQWSDALWIPMFQFALPGQAPADGPRRVVAELGCASDGWALARWFVQPNAGLAGHSPIACLECRLPEVMLAARADRL